MTHYRPGSLVAKLDFGPQQELRTIRHVILLVSSRLAVGQAAAATTLQNAPKLAPLVLLAEILERHLPARLGIGWRMIFLMDNPAGGGHPLDVARAGYAAIAGGIAMLDFAVIEDGYRLEAAMRVLANPATRGCRREFMGPA
jgi:hypothetical protein